MKVNKDLKLIKSETIPEENESVLSETNSFKSQIIDHEDISFELIDEGTQSEEDILKNLIKYFDETDLRDFKRNFGNFLVNHGLKIAKKKSIRSQGTSEEAEIEQRENIPGTNGKIVIGNFDEDTSNKETEKEENKNLLEPKFGYSGEELDKVKYKRQRSQTVRALSNVVSK